MLHKRSEESTTRQFAENTRKLLNTLAGKLHVAAIDEETAASGRRDVRNTLIDLFGLMGVPGSAAYCVDCGPCKEQILCLDLGVHYEPDGEKLAKVLGKRLESVLTRKPRFDLKKAAAAIEAGVITEAELARCVTPVARPTAILRDASGRMTPKDIKPGEGRVNPLTLAKGLKLQWNNEQSNG